MTATCDNTIRLLVGLRSHFSLFQGRSSSLDSGKAALIASGVAADYGMFPWQVYLRAAKDPEKTACGGTLIAPSWVATAVHCLLDPR